MTGGGRVSKGFEGLTGPTDISKMGGRRGRVPPQVTEDGEKMETELPLAESLV